MPNHDANAIKPKAASATTWPEVLLIHYYVNDKHEQRKEEVVGELQPEEGRQI